MGHGELEEILLFLVFLPKNRCIMNMAPTLVSYYKTQQYHTKTLQGHLLIPLLHHKVPSLEVC